MNPQQAIAWLDAHVNLETGVGVPHDRDATPTLERMQALVALLGSPQLDLDAVHVTGTNGKTSVARMVSALLAAAGFSTGTYTSPHLESVHERLVVDGEAIPDPVLANVLDTVRLAEEHAGVRPSYFEVLTAAAYWWFNDYPVEAAVVEVGVGGRWDATNVLDGRVAVVTNVSIDHVEYLGPTEASIAAEKAGIVKPGARLVLGETAPDLAPAFLDRAPGSVARRGEDFELLGRRRAHGGMVLDLRSPLAEYRDVFLPLHGAYQADNAAIALAAAEAFVGEALPRGVVDSAFAAVRSPGRVEVLGHQPLVILDGAHNVAGARALLASLREEFPDQPRTLVVGLLREKEPREMLSAFEVAAASHVVCCRPPSARGRDPDDLVRAAIELGAPSSRVHAVSEVRDAVAVARECTPDDGQILVTGSLYVVGAARSALLR